MFDTSAAPPIATRLARYPSLQGRVVLITGGATGIGATLVEHFVAQGSRVGFIDLAADAGRALAERLADAPGALEGVSATPPVFVAADLTDIDALRAAIGQVRQAFGPVTVLLNNAANDTRHPVESVTSESWDRGIAVNLKHQFFCAQAVIDGMRESGGGSIVNFGSLSWMIKQGGMPIYTTSKSAIQGLTRSLARDFGPHKVRVNTLLPGWVMTDKQVRLWVNDQAREEIARGQCINEPLLPLHIASMALFLGADDSAMCTAQTFTVDGGWT
jgi:NAD(P)-dependent dehydrogenase (short-subunit alcohol dehydrogenase family)